MVGAGGVDAVLVGEDLPELGADLVAALASLDVDDLTARGGRATESEPRLSLTGAKASATHRMMKFDGW